MFYETTVICGDCKLAINGFVVAVVAYDDC